MTDSPDVVVIGAGIFGLNIALQLVRRSNLRVVVLEKGASLGEGSSGSSSAVCRFRYSRPEMVQIAKDSVAAYQNWSDYLDVAAPLASYRRDGVLWLGDGRPNWPDEEATRLRAFGLRAEVLNDQDVLARYPSLNPCLVAPDLVTGADHECVAGGRHLLEVDGGYIDPVDALQDLISALKLRGVEIRFGSEVSDITVDGGKVVSVTLATGERISCGVVVNAAGPWCRSLYQMVGLSLPWPLQPTRIQVVHLDRPAAAEGHIPICIDTLSGIYFRTQNRGQQILVSSVREEDEREAVGDPDHFARYVDDDFAQAKLHALHHRIPALSYSGVRGYSGLYTVNLADVHPIVGRTPVDGFLVANGCSGHGFKLAPAIGSIIAQLISGGQSRFGTSVAETFIAYDRVPIKMDSMSVLA
jgi:glycine/D-amino acid oxidase-like deaminating enzyme